MVVGLFLLNCDFRLLLRSTVTSEEPGAGGKWEHPATGGPTWTEVDRGPAPPTPPCGAERPEQPAHGAEVQLSCVRFSFPLS